MGITLNSPPPSTTRASSDPIGSGAPAVMITNATVHRGGRAVLEVGHLEIPRGVTALVGPNGSGKSTLLHAIAGVLPLSSGTLTVHGEVAYVLQSQHASQHLLVTAREVVALARASRRGPFRRLTQDDRNAVDDAMERLDIASLGRRHLAELSGGQRQRVFVAQGLAQGADILLLDEPVAGLDIVSIDAIRQIITEERAAGRAIVVATHDLDEAARADHVVLLNGRVISSASPSEALTPEHLIAAYGGRVLALGDDLVAIDDGIHRTDHEHHHHDH